jgi:hypothetical protein
MRHSPVAKQSFGGLERSDESKPMILPYQLNGLRNGHSRRQGYKEMDIKFLSFRIRNFVTPIIESVRTPARITPYPTGRLFWGDAVPGTSCQATIAPSLRDISQQALASGASTGAAWQGRSRRMATRAPGLPAVPTGKRRRPDAWIAPPRSSYQLPPASFSQV